jgi:hypothetical protein
VRKSIKNLGLSLIAVGAFALTACMSGNSNPAGSGEEGYATVLVQTKTSNVNRLSKPGLSKSSVITLDSLYVTAISDAATPDTVSVKLAVGDSGFSASAIADQNVGIVLNLKALRSWTISARTVDVNDSIIQSGSVSVPTLKAGQTRVVNLVANPNFTIYNATFNFPDSIFSPTGNFGQNLTLTKIELLVDGAVVANRNATLAPDTNHVLSYDYVGPDADSVTLKVYGNIDSADAPYDAGNNLLYSKTVAISSLVAVYPIANTVPLTWRGPVQGVADLNVEIKKVGTVDITGTTNPVILNKK